MLHIMFNLYNKVTASKLNDQLSKQKETQKKFLSFILKLTQVDPHDLNTLILNIRVHARRLS